MKKLPVNWGYFAEWIHDPISGLYNRRYMQELDLTELNDEIRAVLYTNMVIGEVNNGGVAQLYSNKALDHPEFPTIDRIIAKHEALADVADLAHRILEPMDELKKEVVEARETGEWPESFFEANNERFADVEKELQSIYELVISRISLHILQNPEQYYDIEEPAGWVPSYSGVRDMSYNSEQGHHKCELVFENGFPHGPNIMVYPSKNICTATVILSPDRAECYRRLYNNDRGTTEITIENSITGSRSRSNYFKNGNLKSVKNAVDGKSNVGEQYQYEESGLIESYRYYDNTEVSGYKKPLVNKLFYPSGDKKSVETLEGEFTKTRTYWPDGSLNRVYTQALANSRETINLEAYDLTGNSLLSAEGNGTIEYPRSWKLGDIGKLATVEVTNGIADSESLTVRPWPKKND